MTEPVLRIDGVSKRFGSVVALDGVTTEILNNEFFALLGPSGCGKTTLLRMLAGFEDPDAGRLLLDGQDLIGTKPYRRPLNMMFQSYALFPHMTVEQNVMYGLRAEGVRKDDARGRAREALAQVQLGELGGRQPAQLSGGQRQRVALARALVKRPRVLLLDEPLSALDRQIRGEMQMELKRLQHQVGITFVVVTHDQDEALTMADRIAVMRDGRIEQLGTPEDLYERPATRFVAGFLGDANFFTDEASGATLVLRPERLRLRRRGSAAPGPGPTAIEGRIAEVAYLGNARKYVVDVPGRASVHVRESAQAEHDRLTAGDEVVITWDAKDAVAVPADDGAAAPAVVVHA